MKTVKSLTLLQLLKHWNEKDLPKVDDELGFGSITLPFNLQNFCLENDELLKLIPNPDIKRKVFAKSTSINLGDRGNHYVWAVFEGTEEEGTKGKTPIAFFFLESDANRFVFGEPIKETERDLSPKMRLLKKGIIV